QDRILDLFCGMGNFSLPLAQQACEVIGIEGVDELVARAQTNIERNQLTNVQFYKENLEQLLEQQMWITWPANKVVLDPSRAGALAVMPYLVKLSPSHIVYVSCHPATMVRDCMKLVKHG